MNRYSRLIVFAFLLLSKISYCDVIAIGSHTASMCVKITNINDYPEISLIGTHEDGGCPCKTSYEIVSSECLHAGSQFDSHNIYAVKKTYITGKDIKIIDWPKDKNALKSNIYINPRRVVVVDSIPIYSIEQFFKILGFTETSVILFKWKEVTMDNNGDLLSENEFNYDGDLSKLSQKILVGINSKSYNPTFELYPNPAQHIVFLEISNFYQGSISVEIVSFGGKVLKSITLNKTGFIYDSSFSIENLTKGIYFVTFRYGAMVETQKLIIN
jgi:hypothetical protein